ncbi:extracellular solute-binding protein [Levilactobacillus spicheri]|uniref:ABC transporter substrate-binding protein n=2 Tax=Levilactobacillus spicheri TaxID=216463 RepID=A0ABQ0WNT1_9LACO|nr:extracellular solute-binding protein [Levilactobacillus spicheri]KRL46745.1 hypothetical protein FD37_GL000216 [Levilactobacillus spicheri DSM 15429]GEO66742.1 ABC transporter substrate-binding protein [Levilactobacillus spicheri]
MNKHSWKKLSVLALTGLAALSLAACGSKSASSSSSKTTTITFWNGFTASDGTNLKKIVAEYNKTNKDHVKVKMDQMSWDNFNEKLPTAITAKKAPDFVAMNYGDMAGYVHNGTMKDMSDFYNYKGVDKSNFQQSAINMGKIKGKDYFIPMQVQGNYLYWNKDLFKKAGIDPNTKIQTMDQYMKIAKKIKALGNGVQGTYWSDFAQWSLVYGGSILNKAETKSTINSAANRKVLNQFRQMMYVDKLGNPSTQGVAVDNLMFAGKLGLEVSGPWLNEGMIKNHINYGVTQFPSLTKNGKKQAWLAGVGFGIPTSTDDSKTKAIYSFVKYWNTKKTSKKWSQENKCAPYLKDVAADKQIKNDPVISELAKQTSYSKVMWPGNVHASDITTNVITPMCNKVVTGSDVNTQLKLADQKINKILKGDN